MELDVSFRLFAFGYNGGSNNSGVAASAAGARVAGARVALAASARVNCFDYSGSFNYGVILSVGSFIRTTASNHRGSEGNNCEVN